MSVAWSRFDAEIEQLKRLSAQLSSPSIPSVPATLRAQSRRQSAANRRSSAALQANQPPHPLLTMNTCGTNVLTSQLSGSTIHSQSLLLHVPATVCVSSSVSSTTLIQTTATSSHICSPTIDSSQITAVYTLRQSSNVNNVEPESCRIEVTRTDESFTTSDESGHLVISTPTYPPQPSPLMVDVRSPSHTEDSKNHFC